MTSAQRPLFLERTGVVCPVGMSAPAACAAIRAKLTHPVETDFIDTLGRRFMGHSVTLAEPWRGLTKLARMAALAIDECLQTVPRAEDRDLPVLLCIAERDRPGRIDGLDEHLFAAIEALLDRQFSVRSGIVPHGRVGIPVAMSKAAEWLAEGDCRRVLVVGVDSLLHWPTLSEHEKSDRLLTAQNSNGFAPGEGAAALLVSHGVGTQGLYCTGVGFGVEPASIGSGEPLRGDGITQAVRQALAAAGRELHEMDLRIADLSGEQYYFKEAALLLSRTMRQLKSSFDLWHPAECTGEAGAAAGAVMLAVVDAAGRKRYAPGQRTLAHFSADGGRRAALTLEYRDAA